MKAMFPTVLIYTAGDLLNSLLNIYTAGVLGGFFDAVFNLDFKAGISNFGAIIICLLITIFLVPIINMFGETIMFTNSLQHDRICMSRFLNKSYDNAMSMSIGEIQSRLEDDPTELRCNWINIIEKIIIIPISFGYLVYNSIKINVLFTLIVFGVLALRLVIPSFTKKIYSRLDIQYREYRSSVRANETEIFQKPYIFKLFRLSDSMVENMNQQYISYYKNVGRKNIIFKVVIDNINTWIDTFSYLIILFIGAYLTSIGKITAGSVATMLGYFGLYSTVFVDIGSLWKTLELFKNDIERMTVLYSDEEDEGGKNVDNVNLIEAVNIGFKYEKRYILKNVSFLIKRGEKVAIAGKNGSGKSTLALLLCGLLTNCDGKIKINGDDLREISLNRWRNCFSFVEQEPYIFEGTVFDNIMIGNLSANNDTVVSVMKRLGIYYLIDRKITFNDNSLSGGEKQRISIARALIKEKNILIFDEYNNNLDIYTKEWIDKFIVECKETVVFVTHDDVLIGKVDKVIYL